MENTQNSNVQKHIEVFINGISGLRMLGIFGVILYHMSPYHIKGGFLGVTLFFMISGYLLAVKSDESRKITEFKTLDFYIKRIKRLYPQLLVVIFFTCGALSILKPQALNGIKAEIISILFGYNNIWQIVQNASYFERMANSSPFTHMWSLSNEIQMYLIWPVIFFIFLHFIKKMDTKKAINSMGVIAAATFVVMPVLYILLSGSEDFNLTRIYYGTDTRIFSFLTGAYIGFRRTRYRRVVRVKNVKPYCVAFAILTLIIIAAYIFMDGEKGYTYIWGMLAANMVFAAMMMLTTDSRLPIGSFLDHRIFTFFGDISYEMYLWMYPVIYIFHSMGWYKWFGAPLLMFAIIVFLAKWLHSFARALTRKKLDIRGDFYPKLQRVTFVMLSVPLCIMAIYGTGAAAMSAPKDVSGNIQMREDMQKNAEAIEKRKQEEIAARSEKKEEVDEEIKEEVDTQSIEKAEEPRTYTAIGDSVMLGAAIALQEAIPGCIVDAAESRQVYSTMGILEGLNSSGALGNTVVLALGTNGIFNESTGQEIIDYLGKDRDIYWVNVYANSVQWMDDTNNLINTLVANNKNVHLIDWASEGEKHPEWFYADGIHLRPEGQGGYAQFVQNNVVGAKQNQ